MTKKLHEAQLKCAALLAKIGVANGTAAPESQDPLDKALHEMAIAKTLSSIADKRYEAAKKDALNHVSAVARDEIDNIETRVIKSNASMRIHVAAGQFYQLNCEVRLAGSRFDETKLRNKLMTEFKLTTEQLDILWNDCKVANAPRRYFEVVDKGE